ncbi:hypothetical protein Poli38472_006312 [Pythium oligandrum]|uniref:Uncharacterized protein n=1 Tax=Pythium oligandrum TaxID=41045 RepID=A0A8K1CSP1_PYTOL|nr:hypothetical protein Poli38472_006312 [Pythium oligandrum]|eukprot:TMW68844.1 hypothetical protein Poli38472_006312 [Pythium oligandrum]
MERVDARLRVDARGPWTVWTDGSSNGRVSTATARTAHASEALTRGRMNARLRLEQHRVRMELTGVTHMDAPGEPPSGCYFDTTPDATDEVSYDALEKAYNAAFVGCSEERLDRSRDEEEKEQMSTEGADGKMTSYVPALEERKHKAVEDKAVAITRDDLVRWKNDEVARRQRKIAALKESTHGASLGSENPASRRCEFAWELYVLKSNPSVLAHADQFTERRSRKHRVLQSLAEACKSHVITRLRGQQSMIRSIPSNNSSPSDTTESVQAVTQVVVDAKSAPDETKALSQYLVDELSVYTKLLMNGAAQEFRVDSIAQVTALQLFRDHQRALVDFDSEHSRLQSSRSHPVGGDTVGQALSECLNPFQIGSGEGFNGRETWRSNMQSVRYRGNDEGSMEGVNGWGGSSPAVSHVKELYKRGLNAVLLRSSATNEYRMKVAKTLVELAAKQTVKAPSLLVCKAQDLESWHNSLTKFKFLFPAVVGTRQKIMSWNCVAFTTESVRRICDAVGTCTAVLEEEYAIDGFLMNLQKTTLAKSQLELATLNSLEKQGMVKTYSGYDNASGTSCDQRLGVIPNRKKVPKRIITAIPIPTDPIRPSPRMKKLPPIRKGGDITPRSRKRISRCGKCTGCLADDCMECGHCKDMKKYGGPGLRKQSCKNRKCVNPKSWGVQRKRSHKNKKTGEHVVGEESDTDELLDDAGGEYTSQESDPESTSGAASFSLLQSDSDSGESTRLSSRDLLMDDEELLDASSGTEGHDRSKSSRTRVMRCGKCTGCRAPDCMSCRHCQDMKKYGGPGLRKQSCKKRKCIAPKVVMLNQAKEGEEFLDENGEFDDDGEVRSPFVAEHEPKIEESQSVQAEDSHPVEDDDSKLLVVQDCELLLRRYLTHSCASCIASFSSIEQLEQHVLAQHNGGGSSFERHADECLLHPSYQLGMVLALKQMVSNRHNVRAFAKLEGHNFEYFFLKPSAVLGRMDARWSEFYRTRGIHEIKGLPADSIDCHLGHDSTIAKEHALIKWDAEQQCFTIQCLSYRSSVSVNGREVHYSSHPLPLSSRSLIQIGASIVYFLLPTASPEPLKRAMCSTPRAELQAWLASSVKKRRSEQSQSEAIQRHVRASWTTFRSFSQSE